MELNIDTFENMMTPVGMDEVYFSQLFDIYHKCLLDKPDTCAKLARRGISQETVLANCIGHCDRTLHKHVPPSDKIEGAAFRGALRRVGLTSIHGHEVFRGCIVEPMFADDRLIAAMGIKLICPSRPAPRIIYWFRDTVYTQPLNFSLTVWEERYVTH